MNTFTAHRLRLVQALLDRSQLRQRGDFNLAKIVVTVSRALALPALIRQRRHSRTFEGYVLRADGTSHKSRHLEIGILAHCLGGDTPQARGLIHAAVSKARFTVPTLKARKRKGSVK